MKKQITLIALLLISVFSLDACRPRASRNRTAANCTQPQTAAPSTAQQVMSKADSVLAKVNALSQESREIPPVTAEDYPRTPWGSQYIPKPDLSAYSTFEAGLANFNHGDYDRSLASFAQIVTTGRPSQLVPNSYYWMGESKLATQRYADARPEVEST